jgi:hypothetical protein
MLADLARIIWILANPGRKTGLSRLGPEAGQAAGLPATDADRTAPLATTDGAPDASPSRRSAVGCARDRAGTWLAAIVDEGQGADEPREFRRSAVLTGQSVNVGLPCEKTSMPPALAEPIDPSRCR